MKPEILGAIFGGIAGAIAALPVGLVTNSISQHWSAQQQTALSFADEKMPLVELGTKYIAVVVSGGDLNEMKVVMRSAVAQEIRSADGLRAVLGSEDGLVDVYQTALSDFSSTLENANSPTEMSAWAKTFGRVLDTRRTLDARLRKKAGI